jgi:hypothetical protein
LIIFSIPFYRISALAGACKYSIPENSRERNGLEKNNEEVKCMSEQIKKELQEITEKLKKMDARGLSIMNRDASTILLCQEMMMGENVEREAG